MTIETLTNLINDVIYPTRFENSKDNFLVTLPEHSMIMLYKELSQTHKKIPQDAGVIFTNGKGRTLTIQHGLHVEIRKQ